MQRSFGLMLLDSAEISIRIYTLNQTSPHLLLSHILYPEVITPVSFVKELSRFFRANPDIALHQWKGASRTHSKEFIEYISQTLMLPIEILSPVREQELIFTGLLTEYASLSKDML